MPNYTPGGYAAPQPGGLPLALVPTYAPEPEPVEQLPWDLVTELRKDLSDRVATWSKATTDRGEPTPTAEQRKVFGADAATQTVRVWVEEQFRTGRSRPSTDFADALCQALYSEVFELGRLQPLIDDEDIENIEVLGCDQVWLSYADGSVVPGPAVAASDGELVQSLQMWAANAGRTLSPAKPFLHLDLPDGSRLAAMIETCRRPQVVIRKHRLVDVTLRDLAERGMVSQAMAEFLRAAVLTNANIVVTGPPNAGKTTLLRALAAEIPPMERFATLETDFELHLDEIGRHPRVVAFQAREGSTERAADGRPAGEFTLQDLVQHSLRLNFSRLIVGEVRGAEVVSMLEAITTGGKGSLCTIHANSARDAFERIVSLCFTRAGMSDQLAYRLAAEAISYIVNVTLIDTSIGGEGGERHRFVDQIAEVNGMGEPGRPAFVDVFVPGPDLRGVPAHPPRRLPLLERAGFDRGWLNDPGGGRWMTPSPATAPRGPRRAGP